MAGRSSQEPPHPLRRCGPRVSARVWPRSLAPPRNWIRTFPMSSTSGSATTSRRTRAWSCLASSANSDRHACGPAAHGSQERRDDRPRTPSVTLRACAAGVPGRRRLAARIHRSCRQNGGTPDGIRTRIHQCVRPGLSERTIRRYRATCVDDGSKPWRPGGHHTPPSLDGEMSMLTTPHRCFCCVTPDVPSTP